MAFLKTADAHVISPIRGLSDWKRIRTAKEAEGALLNPNIELLSKFSSDQFLISHCTIVSSVDVEAQPVNATGWPYYVTPETAKYVNNNQDCWERDLLKGCFKTFIGGENYVEHIQIPELSKGKIIDAVARDIGESIYIDILVATDRRHNDLVTKIASGEMDSLSMGCSVSFTVCTKCGNVAKDEVDLCNCIKYAKGNIFIDSNGVRRVIAELCGHKSQPESVKFVEASWVKKPAFGGAVVRNILTDESTTLAKMSVDFNFAHAFEPQIVESLAEQGITQHDMRKAFVVMNALKTANRYGQDEEEEAEEVPAEETAPAAEPATLETDFSDVKEKLRQKLLQDISDEVDDLIAPDGANVLDISEGDEESVEPSGSEDLNENLIQSSIRERLRSGLVSLQRGSKLNWGKLSRSQVARVVLAFDRQKLGTSLPPVVYEVLGQLSTEDLADKNAILAAVKERYKKPITPREFKMIVKRAGIIREF